MQKYISQIVAELRTIAMRSPFSFYQKKEEDLYPLQYANLENLFHFDKNNFPAVEHCTEAQTDLLVQEILRLFRAYNLYTLFPVNVPTAKKYQLLIDFWDSHSVKIHPETFYRIDFCQLSITCPFGKNCYCDNDDTVKMYGLN